MQGLIEYKDALNKVRDLESALSCAQSALLCAETELTESLADRIAERFKDHAEFLPSYDQGHYRIGHYQMGLWTVSIYKELSIEPYCFTWETDCKARHLRAASRGLVEYEAKNGYSIRLIPTARAAPKALLLRNADSVDAWLDELIQYLLDLQNVKLED